MYMVWFLTEFKFNLYLSYSNQQQYFCYMYLFSYCHTPQHNLFNLFKFKEYTEAAIETMPHNS